MRPILERPRHSFKAARPLVPKLGLGTPVREAPLRAPCQTLALFTSREAELPDLRSQAELGNETFNEAFARYKRIQSNDGMPRAPHGPDAIAIVFPSRMLR